MADGLLGIKLIKINKVINNKEIASLVLQMMNQTIKVPIVNKAKVTFNNKNNHNLTHQQVNNSS